MSRALLLFGVIGLMEVAGCSDDGKNPDQGTMDKGPPSEMMVTADKGPPAEQGVIPDGGVAVDKPSQHPMAAFFPGGNDVEGWFEDPDTGKPGVETGTTKAEIEAIINGTHDPYDAEGCTGFAKQDYKIVDGAITYKVSIYLWEMVNPEKAQKMMEMKKKEDEDNNGVAFTGIQNLADAAYMGDDTPNWKVHGFKSKYVLKIIGNHFDAAHKDIISSDVSSFARWILNKINPS